MYEAIYKKNQLIYGTGNDTLFVTGWTPKEKIAKLLKSEDYAAIGNLYSSIRGINFLVRNILNNPQITRLLMLSETKADNNSGSCQCLFDFFFHGFRDDGDCWIVKSEIKGYIDKDIPSKYLDLLRSSLDVYLFKSKEDLLKALPPINLKIPRKEAYLFPIKSVEHKILPSNIYEHTVREETIANCWVKILQRIRKNGLVRPTGYDGQWQELISLKVIVENEPLDYYFPTPNFLPIDREYLTNYIPQILEDAPYQENVKYTYGQRLRSWFGHDQIQEVINKLKAEHDSASAVMSLWDAGNQSSDSNTTFLGNRALGDSDHQHGGSPCLNHIWVRILEGKLSMTATFRSNDMFSAWVANAMGLRALQVHIRDEVDKDLELAPLTTISHSAHIYDDCWENADNLINALYYKKNTVNYNDPVGNFIIEFEQGIKVIQTNQEGTEVNTYFGQNPLSVMREIVKYNPTIQSDHIGYLGIELQKIADRQVQYSQDKI